VCFFFGVVFFVFFFLGFFFFFFFFFFLFVCVGGVVPELGVWGCVNFFLLVFLECGVVG